MSAITEKLAVRFGEPSHGWLPVEVYAGIESFSFYASDIYPSLGQLVSALHTLVDSAAERVVVWTSEPTEYAFRFDRSNSGEISLLVREFSDYGRAAHTGTQVLSSTGNYPGICLPFWRAICSLQGRYSAEEWNTRWTTPFPGVDLKKLTELLRIQRIIA